MPYTKNPVNVFPPKDEKPAVVEKETEKEPETQTKQVDISPTLYQYQVKHPDCLPKVFEVEMEAEAIALYKEYAGIISTIHPFQVVKIAN